MLVLFVYAVALLCATLVSELAERSVLSTAVLFLAAGVIAGPAVLGVIHMAPADPVLPELARWALVSVLFTDAMRIGARDLVAAWRLPGRALLLGMPLTMAATALFAHLLAGVSWLDAFLLGAVLSPTDPVFASAIVGREEIPGRLSLLIGIVIGGSMIAHSSTDVVIAKRFKTAQA